MNSIGGAADRFAGGYIAFSGPVHGHFARDSEPPGGCPPPHTTFDPSARSENRWRGSPWPTSPRIASSRGNTYQKNFGAFRAAAFRTVSDPRIVRTSRANACLPSVLP